MKVRRLEKGERFFFVILALASVLILFVSVQMFMKDPKLSSQGTFPVLTSLVMLIMSSLVLFESRKYGDAFEMKLPLVDKVKSTFVEIFPGKVFPVIIMVVIYGIALPMVGFVISTFIFLALSMLILKKGQYKIAIIASAGIVAFILILFQFIFRVILP